MNFETGFTGFSDRADGGHKLAETLRRYRGDANAIVVALPRGGVVTAAAVADDLDLPLDVLVVRKLGTPGYDELAMGAIGPGGVRVLNDDVVASLGIAPHQIDAVTKREERERMRRERLYRGGQPPIDFADRIVIVVDDGLATGSTMSAAVRVIRQHNPARIVVAVPVAPLDTVERLRRDADEVTCVETPEPFRAVGSWYEDFAQTEDEEVLQALSRARAHVRA